MQKMHARAIAFATLTLAAGISSTGDPELDRRLPFEEPYRIPDSTAAAIRRAREHGGRQVAVGTTVVRALEHAASRTGRICGGEGLADQRVGREQPSACRGRHPVRNARTGYQPLPTPARVSR
jgi:S-adenosylmethionine:tRNA ribosyltransferase-isomerase